jgi:hypothetical protein
VRRGYPTLRLSSAAGWECDDVALATGVVSRLVGMSARNRSGALLMWGDSVHTMWMRRAITLVFVDRHGSVLSTRRALPGLVYRHRGAAWVLEIAGVVPVPRPGTTLWVSNLPGWPAG